MRNLVILSEDDIRKLANDEMVALRDSSGKDSTVVILSEKAYELYKKGQYIVKH